MIRRVLFMLTLLALTTSGPAVSHEILHQFTGQEASVLRLTYGDGSPFSFEQYELRFGEEEVPFQVGRTDAEGRIVFLPHRPGRWRVRAFSEDGHGVDLSLDTGPGGAPAARSAPVGNGQRLLTGVSVIFGIFGLLSLLFRRRYHP